MKISLIGGTGLVGSYLLPMLVERNDQIFALSRREYTPEKSGIQVSLAFAVISEILTHFSMI